MDLSLTESQQLLKRTARDFMQQEAKKELLLDLDRTESGFSNHIWRTVAEMGWLGIVTPEQYGGSGGSLFDAAVVFEELGRGPLPGPFFSSSILGSLLMQEGATEEQKQRLLPRIAQGEDILALALTESDYGWGPESVQMEARQSQGGFMLNGAKVFVHDALSANLFVCAARARRRDHPADGITLFLVGKDAPGVSVRGLPGFLANVGEVTFDAVKVSPAAVLGQIDQGWPALERATRKTIPVLCAYKVGGCQAAFDMSLEYSRTRIAFGMPIGRFQHVQDHVIQGLNATDAARWTAYEALWKLDTGLPATASVHLAKVVASEGYYNACNEAHKTLAGAGLMREFGMTLHTKMSRTLYHFLGGPKYHRRRLAEALRLEQ